MPPLNQIIRERKQFVRELKAELKEVDTALEKAERLTARIIQRKLKVPEESDLQRLAQLGREMSTHLTDYLKKLGAGFVT
jgi:hypothetical protein